MTTKAEWLQLAERCERATGPDREIDALIWLAVCDAKMRFSKATGGWAFFVAPLGARAAAHLSGVKGSEADAIAELGMYDFLPRATRSLDAITALIERELPAAWTWTIGQNIHHRVWGCSVNNLDHDGAPYSLAWGSSKNTPALALAAAFCRAMAETVSD